MFFSFYLNLLSFSLPSVTNFPGILCIAGLDERSGSSPWAAGEQGSPSFNHGRVRKRPGHL